MYIKWRSMEWSPAKKEREEEGGGGFRYNQNYCELHLQVIGIPYPVTLSDYNEMETIGCHHGSSTSSNWCFGLAVSLFFWSLLSKILVFLLILQTCRKALLFVWWMITTDLQLQLLFSIAKVMPRKKWCLHHQHSCLRCDVSSWLSKAQKARLISPSWFKSKVS